MAVTNSGKRYELGKISSETLYVGIDSIRRDGGEQRRIRQASNILDAMVIQ